MVDLTKILNADLTLQAADKALAGEGEPPRPYLGMSQIGEPCSRKLWYRFRWACTESFNAEAKKRFRDGHSVEALIKEQLNKVCTIEQEQATYTDLDGHFVGHCDGVISGLLEAPKTKHVLEVKASAKLNAFKTIKQTWGEKLAVKKWNPVYYAQIVLYMAYEGLDRAYHVIASPGARDWASARTEADSKEAEKLREKARKIIYAQNPPERVNNDPAWFECRNCAFNKICHEGALPERSCRTCAHSSPSKDGKWSCALDRGDVLCEAHCYIPSLVNGEIVSSTATSVTYKLPSGEIWQDGCS